MNTTTSAERTSKRSPRRMAWRWIIRPILLGTFILSPGTAWIGALVSSGSDLRYRLEFIPEQCADKVEVPADVIGVPEGQSTWLDVTRESDHLATGTIEVAVFFPRRQVWSPPDIGDEGFCGLCMPLPEDANVRRVVAEDLPWGPRIERTKAVAWPGAAFLLESLDTVCSDDLPIPREHFVAWTETLELKGRFLPEAAWAMPHVDHSLWAPGQMVIASGWPWRAFLCVVKIDCLTTRVEVAGGVLADSPEWRGTAVRRRRPYIHIPRCLPLLPIASGLFLNALAWSLIAVTGQVVWLGTREGQAYIRARNDRCPTCGYPLRVGRGSAICPECGAIASDGHSADPPDRN